MISERARADRRTALRALVGSAAAVVLTVMLTSGVSQDAPANTRTQPPPPHLAFLAD